MEVINNYEEGNFTENEIGGCVCPKNCVVENPTILNADGDEIVSYEDDVQEDGKVEDGKFYVVQSAINLSTTDTDTSFEVVGVADNKMRAKQMVKEEVKEFFSSYNERFVSNDPEENWGVDHPLSVYNEKDFPTDDYYLMNDIYLEVYCEIKIVEKTINTTKRTQIV